jgi:high-affinity Fe2+/Pb2+ permease
MPKALCIVGLAVSGLIAVMFAADLAIKFPFQRASIVMDVSLIVCAGLLGLISWLTFREQA